MATHKSALKRNKQAKVIKERNSALKSRVKNAINKFCEATTSDKEKAGNELKNVISVISKATSKGVYHKKTSSRKISRLSKLYNKSSNDL